MALKLFLGNSGSGKTETMYGEVVRRAEQELRKNFLVIVPEQFTLQTQRKLVDLSGNQAIMNIDVLSFKRLAYRIFDEVGIDQLDILEETGKNLVLRKISQEQEENLTVLRGNMHRMGYIGEVKSFLSELMQYNISPQELEDVIGQASFSPLLTAKLKDIRTMYQAFTDYLRGNYITSEELLHVLAGVASQSELLKESVLVLDEFTGFTPVQVELLKTLMPLCSEIWVALTIDEKEDFFHSKGMQELFDMPKKTIRILSDLAVQTHTPIPDPVILSHGDQKRFRSAPALYFMEQNIFRKNAQRQWGETEEIQIYSLKNPREELIWAARKIRKLVRDHGYRYQDIAVVSGNVQIYGNYAQQVFPKYEIPYFLDMTKEVLFHPFIEFIRAVLELVRSDFSYNAVMRLLRSGYCQIDTADIDRLENYLLATGIRGKKMWNQKWLRLPKNEKAYDLERLNQIRTELMEGFSVVEQAFSTRQTVETRLKALYQYMTQLQVEKQLFAREKELLEQGEEARAREYQQIYPIVMDLFEKCIRILGQEYLSVEDLEEILDAGFEAAKVAVVPPGADSVTIGDIERTRLNHVSILIFLGVNEGIIPKALRPGGIISQFDRDALESANLRLAPGTREQAFIQKFYLYLNMTKPSERLYLTYSRVDSEGKELRPSYLIRTILHMFPDMRIHQEESMEQILDFSSVHAAKEYLLTENRNRDWYALAKCFLESEDENVRAHTQVILDAFYHQYHHDPISHVVAEAIYGKQIEGSVTRLEKFARCAYAHFLNYGLKLRERENSGFESVDMGNLYHAAVEIYSKKLAGSDYDWMNIPEEKRDAFAEESMEEAILSYPNLSIYTTAESTHMVQRMNHIFQKTIWALTEQVRKGKFVPNEFEFSFSRADHLDALKIELDNGNAIRLVGRIDRMDTCTEEDKLYVKVIDYKSGNTSFDLLQLYHGMQLQLVVYMNAAMELEKKQHEKKQVLPGGLFYYHIDDPVIEVTDEMSDEQIRQEILKQLRPDGLVNAQQEIYRAMDEDFETKSDVIPVTLKKNGELAAASSVASTEEFEILAEYVSHHIMHTGNEIYGGNISAAPFTDGRISGCDYCPYRSVCGFDERVPGYEMRKGKKIDKKEIFAQMEMENAKNRVRNK